MTDNQNEAEETTTSTSTTNGPENSNNNNNTGQEGEAPSASSSEITEPRGHTVSNTGAEIRAMLSSSAPANMTGSSTDKDVRPPDVVAAPATTTSSPAQLPSSPIPTTATMNQSGTSRYHRSSQAEKSGSLNGSSRPPRSRIGTLYHRSPSGKILLRNSVGKLEAAGGGGAPTSASPPNEQSKSPLDDADDVTWGQVYRTCCCHSAREWASIGIFTTMLLTTLYFFLVGLDLLSTGFKVAQYV